MQTPSPFLLAVDLGFFRDYSAHPHQKLFGGFHFQIVQVVLGQHRAALIRARRAHPWRMLDLVKKFLEAVSDGRLSPCW